MVYHNIVDTNVPVNYACFLNEILVSWSGVLCIMSHPLISQSWVKVTDICVMTLYSHGKTAQ